MATGKTINELPDVEQLMGGEMIPVSSYTQNKYITGKTTVKNISDNVLVTVDEKIKDFVSKSDLCTALNSYVSNDSLNTTLENYASTASVDEKLSNYASTASVDEKLNNYATYRITKQSNHF